MDQKTPRVNELHKSMLWDVTHFPQTWSFLEFLILFGSDYRIPFGIKKKESHISNFEHNQLFTLSALLVHCTRKDSKPGHDVVWNYMTEALFLSKDEFKLHMYWRLSIRCVVLHTATKEYIDASLTKTGGCYLRQLRVFVNSFLSKGSSRRSVQSYHWNRIRVMKQRVIYTSLFAHLFTSMRNGIPPFQIHHSIHSWMMSWFKSSISNLILINYKTTFWCDDK